MSIYCLWTCSHHEIELKYCSPDANQPIDLNLVNVVTLYCYIIEFTRWKNSTLLNAKNVYYLNELYYSFYCVSDLPYYILKITFEIYFSKTVRYWTLKMCTIWTHYKSYCVTVLYFEITFEIYILKSRRNRNCFQIKCNFLFGKSCSVMEQSNNRIKIVKCIKN